MKKTLLVTTDYEPNVGGVAVYNKQIANAFLDDIVVLTNVEGESTKQVVRKQFLSFFMKPSWLFGVFPVLSELRKNDCEQIFVSEILPAGPIALILNKLFKIPYVLQVHGMDVLQAGVHPFKRRLAKLIIHSAKSIIVNSKSVQTLLNETYGEVKSTTVYPVPESYPNAEEKIKQELVSKYDLSSKKIILSIGRLVGRKGHAQVLGAMIHVWQSHQDAIYVIIGDGHERETLETMAEPHGNQVIFTGKVSNDEKYAWLELCHFFVMPALADETDVEGFGIVYLEAASFAKPSIASNVGGAVEAVLDKKTGLLVDPTNIDDIATQMNLLLKDNALRIKLGKNAKERVQNELLWSEQVKKLKNLL